MAWTEAARKASALARKRRAQLFPKPQASSRYPNAMKNDRALVATALKWGRNFGKGKVGTRPGPMSDRKFLTAWEEGRSSVKKR